MMRMISTTLGAFALAAVAVAAPASAATTVVTKNDGTWSARYLGATPSVDLGTTDLSTAGSSVTLGSAGAVAALGADRLRQAPAGSALAGIYVFSKVFPLSDVGNMQSIALRWLADNQLFAVVVNGSVVFEDGIEVDRPFDTTIQSTTVNLVGSPLQNGSNTLHWLVWNRQTSNNNVSLAGEAVMTAVPEPGTWLLMILGLGAVGFAMRRRQTATVRYQFA